MLPQQQECLCRRARQGVNISRKACGLEIGLPHRREGATEGITDSPKASQESHDEARNPGKGKRKGLHCGYLPKGKQDNCVFAAQDRKRMVSASTVWRDGYAFTAAERLPA